MIMIRAHRFMLYIVVIIVALYFIYTFKVSTTLYQSPIKNSRVRSSAAVYQTQKPVSLSTENMSKQTIAREAPSTTPHTIVTTTLLSLPTQSINKQQQEKNPIKNKNKPTTTTTTREIQNTIDIKYHKSWKEKKYKMPPPETMQAIMRNIITDEENKCKDKILLTAVVNSGMLDYTFNWIESLRRTGQDDRFLVFAIDEGVIEVLAKKGYQGQVTLIPEDWFHVPLSSDFSLWKSVSYRPITHAKTLIVERLLYLGITVWFSDVDIVLLDKYTLPLMLFQMNERPNTDMVFSQEVDQRTINSGFYMIRPTHKTKQLMGNIINEQDKANSLTQQKIMNGVLRSMFGRDLQKIPYRLLDMLLFPNGKYYFRLKMPQKLGIKPMIVHANYLVGDKKKNALKSNNLWFIDEKGEEEEK